MSRAIAFSYTVVHESRRPLARRSGALRPDPPERRIRRFGRAVSASAQVFRGTLARPTRRHQPEVGTLVRLRGGTTGRIEGAFLGVRSGRFTFAVTDPALPADQILLIPAEALGEKAGVATLTDPTAPVAVPREAAPAA